MLKLLSEAKEVFCFYLKLVVRVGVVGVNKVVGGEGVRADGGATGVQGFLWEEEKVGQREREEYGRRRGRGEERKGRGPELRKKGRCREGREGKVER